MKEAGNSLISILGRTKELLILEDEFAASDELIVVTDDGLGESTGNRTLAEICGRNRKPDLAVAIGPAIMMKFCCETTAVQRPPPGSLNAIMVDGHVRGAAWRRRQTKFVRRWSEFDGRGLILTC